MSMIRLSHAIAAVMGCTVASGILGGVAGQAIGRLAPSFVLWLYSPGQGAPNTVSPAEFGLGLGSVCGLFLGAATGLFLVVVLAVRDAWLARAGVKAAANEPGLD